MRVLPLDNKVAEAKPRDDDFRPPSDAPSVVLISRPFRVHR